MGQICMYASCNNLQSYIYICLRRGLVGHVRYHVLVFIINNYVINFATRILKIAFVIIIVQARIGLEASPLTRIFTNCIITVYKYYVNI